MAAVPKSVGAALPEREPVGQPEGVSELLVVRLGQREAVREGPVEEGGRRVSKKSGGEGAHTL